MTRARAVVIDSRMEATARAPLTSLVAVVVVVVCMFCGRVATFCSLVRFHTNAHNVNMKGVTSHALVRNLTRIMRSTYNGFFLRRVEVTNKQ